MRITSFFVLALLLIVAPYWLYLPAILIGIIFFPLYLEAIFFSLTIDVVYGSPSAGLFGFPFAIISALLVLIAGPLRTHLRLHA